MYRKLLTLCVMIASLVVASVYFSVGADDLSTVSVTTSDPRPSFRGVMGAGNTPGTSAVTINVTNGAYPATSSALLFINDQVKIGLGASLLGYSVTDIVSASVFNVSPVLVTAATSHDVIASRSGTLAVRFKTRNAIQNGKIRVLVPALSDNTSSSDGLPDAGAFDMTPAGIGVSCPANAPNYTFGVGSTAISSVTVGSTDYHSFVCSYTGLGGIGVGSTSGDFTTNYMSISGLTNPAPKTATHIMGTADTYNVLVQQLDNSSTVVDTTTVNIGVVEAVHVTATVDPQISFRILGIGSGTGVCGITTDVTTTPTSVPFGSLSISAFTDAAQALAVSTNADSYVVTAKENDQLSKGGVTCTTDGSGVESCIIDSNATSISHTNPATWSSTTFKGFGYTLDDANTSGLTAAFEHSTGTGNCAGSDCYKQFADSQASEDAQTIFSSSSTADNHNLYVCYKAIVSSTQLAGDYENYVTYTATATF